MKKRGLTLAGAIIGTVFSALETISALYLFIILMEALASSGASGFGILMVTCALCLAFAIVCLVLNAISIKGYNADAASFQKLRGKIIAAIVFNFLLVLSGLYSLIEVVDMMTLVVNVLVLIALVAANVFMIVDLCLENKRVQANTTNAVENQQNQQNQ